MTVENTDNFRLIEFNASSQDKSKGSWFNADLSENFPNLGRFWNLVREETIRKKCVLSCGATATFDTQDPEIRLEVRTEDDILMRNRYQMTKLQTGISAVR